LVLAALRLEPVDEFLSGRTAQACRGGGPRSASAAYCEAVTRGRAAPGGRGLLGAAYGEALRERASNREP